MLGGVPGLRWAILRFREEKKQLLLGARMLLVAPGLTTSNKKLLV